MNIMDSIIQKIIRQVDGGYVVFSHKGKRLGGPYPNIEQAKNRLRQVEYFKHIGKIQKLAMKRRVYDPQYGKWREGMPSPKGLRRGDYFRDKEGNLWGIVGLRDRKRVVAAWKVPEYRRKGPVLIPRGFERGVPIGPRIEFDTLHNYARKREQILNTMRSIWDTPHKSSGMRAQFNDLQRQLNVLDDKFRIAVSSPSSVKHGVWASTGTPKHKKRIKFTRGEREVLHETRAAAMERNVSRKWPQWLKDKKRRVREMLRRMDAKAKTRTNRILSGSRVPAKAFRNFGLGALGAYGIWLGYKYAVRPSKSSSEQSMSVDFGRNFHRVSKMGMGNVRGQKFYLPKKPLSVSKPIDFATRGKGQLSFQQMRTIGDTDITRVALIGNRLYAQNIIDNQLVQKPVGKYAARAWWGKKISWNNIGKSAKGVGFINDVGYYQTNDKKGNTLFLLPEDGRALEKGTKSVERASVHTLCKLVERGLANV